MSNVTFLIKAEVKDPAAKTFMFRAQKTMYGGKHIAKGDIIFVFASENGARGKRCDMDLRPKAEHGDMRINEGGPGLVARGIVTSAQAIARKPGIARQTPRVSITIRRTALVKRRLGRTE